MPASNKVQTSQPYIFVSRLKQLLYDRAVTPSAFTTIGAVFDSAPCVATPPNLVGSRKISP